MVRMKTLLIWLTVLFPSLLWAQDTIMLNQVEIQGNGVGESVAKPLVARKLDTLVLESKSTSNLSQLLIQHSPVFIKTYGPGGTSTASFRGTMASHTLVLWNGFQLNAPNLGQVDFSTIPVFLADDVNLNWGSGTSNNSGGLGGSINIDNTTVFGEGLILDLKQTYGSFNTLGSFVTVGNRGKKFSFRVKAYRNSSDNDFEYENLATIPHQRMKQQNADFVDYGIMPEISLLFKNCVLSASSWNQWNNRNLPQIMPNVGNKNTEEWTKDNFSRNYISFKTYWQSGSLQLKSAAFFEKQSYFLETRNPVTDDVITSINSQNDAVILHQIANVVQQLYKSWQLNAKLQWDRENVKSNNYEGSKKRDIVSAYAAVDGSPFAFANLKLTARYDIVDGKSMGIFPTATFSYQMPFLKSLTTTLGYSHNYRNPSLNDLYWYPGGNENLLAENGRTLDFALKYALKKERFSAEVRSGVYASKVKNWIQWVPTEYRFWVPENVALVFARGVENHLSIAYNYKDWKFAVSGNYVFTATTDESDLADANGNKGKQLIYIPRHHANFFADVHWKQWNLNYTLEMTGVRNTSYATGSYFSYDLPAYVLHHIALGRQIGKFKLELRCNNFTDKAYQNVLWRAMPGRSWEIMAGWKF